MSIAGEHLASLSLMIGKRGYLLRFPESFLKSNYIRRLSKRNFHSDFATLHQTVSATRKLRRINAPRQSANVIYFEAICQFKV